MRARSVEMRGSSLVEKRGVGYDGGARQDSERGEGRVVGRMGTYVACSFLPGCRGMGRISHTQMATLNIRLCVFAVV